MIEPLPAGIITREACFTSRKAPIRLTRRISAQKAPSCSSKVVQPPEIPALAQATSRPPY